jgi:alkanesulfonate monooxygenase SsuD/methylene tetrahydromethanopterin reductase-like flavin-dependent oxidoreductase (luciferase family)
MEFGLQFFPVVSPSSKGAFQYFQESLGLVDLCDPLGYSHIRTVEHYFRDYGGYSPSPLLFLSAASQRARHARLVAGCVVPAFNNPIKVAGEIGMLDAISSGRLEVGFARAFLPHEFEAFGIPLDESKARFLEGLEQIRRLLEEDLVSMPGRFHCLSNVTSLPRPTQTPRPPFWIAASSTADSFAEAGRAGHGVMAIPLSGGTMHELLGLYREAWKSADHPGEGRVMLAFHMMCAESTEEAIRLSAEPINAYLRSLVLAASEWKDRAASKDYPDYGRLIENLSTEDFSSQLAKGAVWVGSPADICDAISDYSRKVSGFNIASLQVNFSTISAEVARKSMELFSCQVMPHFRNTRKKLGPGILFQSGAS